MKDKILYEQSLFWLLRGWPEFREGDARAFDVEKALIEQCKANKVRISNPELLPFAIYNNGFPATRDIFDFPEGLKVEVKGMCKCDTPPRQNHR